MRINITLVIISESHSFLSNLSQQNSPVSLSNVYNSTSRQIYNACNAENSHKIKYFIILKSSYILVSAVKCVNLAIHRPVPLGLIIHYMLIKKQNKPSLISTMCELLAMI